MQPSTPYAVASFFDLKKISQLLLPSAFVLILAGCSETMNAHRGFSPAEYGVAASERVVAMGEPVPKGGGIYRVGNPYQVHGRWYYPEDKPGFSQSGVASWYGDDFHGRKTANGEIYNMYALSAAHPTLPMPSYARVTNTSNGRSVVVRINDRGPYYSDRVIDLSKRAALLLNIQGSGLGRVHIDYIGKAPLNGNDEGWLTAQARNNGRPMSRQQVALLAPVPGWAQTDASQNEIRSALADGLGFKDRQSSRNSYEIASLQEVAPPTIAPDERIGIETFNQSSDSPTSSLQTAAAGVPLALLPTKTGGGAPIASQAVIQAAAGGNGLQLSVGNFNDPAEAMRLRNALQKFGPVSVNVSKTNGAPLYQVKLGPFANPAQAQLALKQAQAQGAAGAQLIGM
jgi:rare lipoprotein A